MEETIIITFGCSWTAGVGSCYYDGLTSGKYYKYAFHDGFNKRLSFRGILGTRFNALNLNFAEPGSSNQRQFRLAEQFFGSNDCEILKNKKVVVLWGITSTTRYEHYYAKDQKFVDFYMSKEDKPNFKISRFLLENFHDHDAVVEQLSHKIRFWDRFFESINIKNIWFDSFNHHEYAKESLRNFLNSASNHKDLLSYLNILHGNNKFTKTYHLSEWLHDSDRLSFLVNKGMLNPYSFHPTVAAHVQIAELFEPIIKEKLDQY